MKLQRSIGQTSQILLLFVQDVSVTTGAGLANVIGSSVSYTWFHNNQISVSTGTASTAGTTGTYSTSAWVMISSSNALGWYQFGAPDGVFATGDSVGIHFYNAPNMVALPVEIELVRDNPLQFSSSKTFLAYTSTSPSNIVQAVGQPIVTSGAGILNVSTQSLVGITVSTQTVDKTGYIVNVSSWANSTVVATSSGVVDVNLVNIWNKSAVTSASGQLQVSTQAVDKTGYLVNVTSFSAAITTNANVIQAYGSAIVTSASGQFQVSTQSLVGITVSTQSLVGITTAANLIQVYGSAVVTSASGQLRVSTQAIDKGGYGVTTNADKLNYDITSTYGSALVTSGAGILNVSTQTLPAAGAGDITTIYGQPIVTSAAGIMDINVKNIVNSPAVTSAAGKLIVSTQSLVGIVVSTQSLVGIVVSTQAIDKGGYGVTTNADKTGYTLTAADKALMMTVINTTVMGESYRASSDAATIPQMMYEVLANVTDFANSGTTRALNSVTSHATGTVQYQYDSTTPSSITRIA